MRALINRIFLVLGFLLGTTSLAQTNPDDFFDGLDTNNVADYDSVMTLLFGQLAQTNYPSGIIWDRTVKGSKMGIQDGSATMPAITGDEFAGIYDELYWSHIDNDHLPNLNEYLDKIYPIYDLTFENDDFLTIPMGILHFDFQELKPNALDDELIVPVGNAFQDNSTTSPFLNKKLFSVAGLVDTIDYDTVHFYFDSSMFFTNYIHEISRIEIDMGDGTGFHTTFLETVETADYSAVIGEVTVTVRITYDNNEVFQSSSTFYNKSDDVGTRSGNGKPNETIYYTTTPDYLPTILLREAKIGIWWADCNASEKIRQPAIFVLGFDPGPFGLLTKGAFKKKYNGINSSSGTLDQLRSAGYDVILVKFRDGVDFVQNRSKLLVKILDDINERKRVNGFEFETVIMGLSLGALTARHALAKMEKGYMDGSRSEAHHCRLYLSNEGEYQGANTQLGMQHFVNKFWTNLSIPHVVASPFISLHYILKGAVDAPAAKQLNIYHNSETGNFNNPDQGEHFRRTDLMNEFDNNFNHFWTHPQKKGYPNFCRLNSFSSGDAEGDGDFLHYVGLSNGELMLSFDGSLGISNLIALGYIREFEYYALNDTPKSIVFQAYTGFGIGLFGFNASVGGWSRKTTKNVIPLDNGPGGYEPIHSSLASLLNPLGNYFEDPCFTPIKSVLDIRDGNINGKQYNLEANGLLFNRKNLAGIPERIAGSTYGYPHLSPSYDPQNLLTPFDAVSATSSNDRHTKIEDGNTNFFIIDEIVGIYYSYLQNDKVGDQQPGYNAEYHAINKMRAGSAVTFAKPEGPYIIRPNSRIVCSAQESITLEPGFESETGSNFLAFIRDFGCSFGDQGGGSKSQANGYSTDQESENEINFESTLESESTKNQIKIYPNPSTGMYNFEISNRSITNENYLIEVVDLSGRKIFTTTDSRQKITFDLADQQSGIYLVKVYFENQVETIRIVKH